MVSKNVFPKKLRFEMQRVKRYCIDSQGLLLQKPKHFNIYITIGIAGLIIKFPTYLIENSILPFILACLQERIKVTKNYIYFCKHHANKLLKIIEYPN